MGCILLLGAVLWTGLLLSAVHVSSTGEALTEKSNLACAGSLCGTETVKVRSLIEKAHFRERGIFTVPALSSTNREVYIDVEQFEGYDYSGVRGPPPPKQATPGQTPHKPDPSLDPPPPAE